MERHLGLMAQGPFDFVVNAAKFVFHSCGYKEYQNSMVFFSVICKGCGKKLNEWHYATMRTEDLERVPELFSSLYGEAFCAECETRTTFKFGEAMTWEIKNAEEDSPSEIVTRDLETR